MVPRPAIPARVSSSETFDQAEKVFKEVAGAEMVPNLQITDPSGNKTSEPLASSKPIVDLTDEPDEELQKAIALSLQEEKERNSTFITQEQADIDRAVAESISESNRRRHTVTLHESENPKDKIRENEWPVGLKNVGNTCWFSAVIQSLFYIPEFRRIVLQFQPQKINCKELDARGLRNVTLVTNLRRLFALMLRGKRKYLDPSDCISILKVGLGDSFSQHDVSEATHLLLQWLEEAFSLWNTKKMEEEGTEKGQMELESETKGESSSANSNNPLIKLFYGQVAVENVDGGEIHSRLEQYGQCIVQASGMTDLHQGIEASMKESTESSPLAENQSQNRSRPSQSYKTLRSLGLIRERWFRDLPPVVTFELKRFLFNNVSQRPEKIHDRVVFPRRIFMDRYLRDNREKTVELRAIAEELVSRKQALEEKINSYEQYGNESEKYSLPRVLRYAKQFMESRRPKTGVQSQPLPSTPHTTADAPADVNGLPSRRRSLSALDNDSIEDDHDWKRRRYLTDDEFRLVNSCLDELHEEVCSDLEKYAKEVARVDTKIEKLYDTPDLQKVPYILHAVMVHGGEAASGHYWSYIWDDKRETWLKFNDHLVTEASWTDLEKDAYGGPHTKASAYCLVYIDEQKKEALLGSNVKDELPDDLVTLVEEDSFKLEEECRNFEEKQREQPMDVDEICDKNVATEVDAKVLFDINKFEVVPVGSSFEVENRNLETLYRESPNLPKEVAWAKYLDIELATYLHLAKVMALPGQEDARTVNFAAYTAANGYVNYVPFAILLVANRFLALAATSSEQATVFLDMSNTSLAERANNLALSDMNNLVVLNKCFKDFIIDAHGFIFAVDCIKDRKKFDHCVPVLCRLYVDGRKDRAVDVNRRLSTTVIFKCLRMCLLPLSNFYVEQFRQAEAGQELIKEIEVTLIPGLVILSNSTDRRDCEVVEQVRNDWCALLTDIIDESTLGNILQLVLDCRETAELINNLPSTPVHRVTNLHQTFNEALRFVESGGA